MTSTPSRRGLLLIRHAETDLAGTFCGHSDPSLNSRGHAQITALLARLSSETFDAIYTSDLHRAVETAEALAEQHALPITQTASLREIHFGDWEALTWAEIEQRDRVYARRWTDAFPGLPAPGGETYAAFQHRVLNRVEDLLRIAEHQRIAVVTHGGPMRVVLQKFLGYSQEQAWEPAKSYCSHFELAGPAAFRASQLSGRPIEFNAGSESHRRAESKGGPEW